ncbi:hypothetical protein KR222_007112, partial [Zaprionus bogoriensis]
MNNKGKRKVLSQRQVCSRMNFLYQAANLMAHSGGNNTLAAYYGKLCRHVGTKSLMHMSPALKRTLCKRCSLPLLPGVNTKLKTEAKLAQHQQQEPQEHDTQRVGTSSKKRRMRRIRRGKRTASKDKAEPAAVAPTALQDDGLSLRLECSLCCSQRRFQIDANNECWPERSEAIVQTVSLEGQTAAA